MCYNAEFQLPHVGTNVIQKVKNNMRDIWQKKTNSNHALQSWGKKKKKKKIRLM